jgi:hypothetical protein
MNHAHPLVLTLAIISLSGQVTAAQVADPSRYRNYALESSLASVVTASGARAAAVKTLHERPASIQELQWHAPYVDARTTNADPVKEILFSFFNAALYQVIVTYDRDRTEGLTDGEIIESMTGAYGVPALSSSRIRTTPPAGVYPDSVVLARWENAEAVVTLVRGAITPEFQLILMSKVLSTRARSATHEAIRLDVIDTPRRESEQRKKDAGVASAARDKARIANKAAFRP